jgi:hypothetical protein
MNYTWTVLVAGLALAACEKKAETPAVEPKPIATPAPAPKGPQACDLPVTLQPATTGPGAEGDRPQVFQEVARSFIVGLEAECAKAPYLSARIQGRAQAIRLVQAEGAMDPIIRFADGVMTIEYAFGDFYPAVSLGQQAVAVLDGSAPQLP